MLIISLIVYCEWSMLEVTLLSCWEMKLSFMLEKAISYDDSENLDLTFRASENAQIPLNICFQCALLSCSVLSDSPQPHGLWPTRLFCPWNFPDRDAGAGCHFLLFPTQGWNPRLLHWQADSLPLSHLGSPTFSIGQEKCRRKIRDWIDHLLTGVLI